MDLQFIAKSFSFLRQNTFFAKGAVGHAISDETRFVAEEDN